ncbi:unnamed protein product [Cylicostephanus goldi]|uniref:Uncharacterized protein n=1 Tax=Cylicostephanus goldi TaxID=71465 RepID=A0A3P6SYN0_CYLGO|nr:unnamed protein product [Cylicostephanus goldi]
MGRMQNDLCKLSASLMKKFPDRPNPSCNSCMRNTICRGNDTRITASACRRRSKRNEMAFQEPATSPRLLRH